MNENYKIETIDDVLNFITEIKKRSEKKNDHLIKSVSFQCDLPNHIKKFEIEYFQFKVKLPGGVEIK